MSRAAREFPGATAYSDRHGVRRWRYRSRHFSAELGRDYGSDDFRRRYEAALKREKVGTAERLQPATIAAVVVSFYGSPAFRNLGSTTRTNYRKILERFRETHAARSVVTMERRHVVALLAERADTPAAANVFLRLLRMLMRHAIDLGLRLDDPTQGVQRFRMANKGATAWSEEEIARYLATHEPGSTARLAMLLMLHTGAARVDAVALGPRNIMGGRLRYRRRKLEGRTDRIVDIPVHPELAEELAGVPAERFTFLETRQGSARSEKALSGQLKGWCAEAGIEDRSAHGLRKACATRLADAGATAHEIAAVTGHASIAEVQRYTIAADRAALADGAFAKLATRTEREQTVVNHPARFAKKGAK